MKRFPCIGLLLALGCASGGQGRADVAPTDPKAAVLRSEAWRQARASLVVYARTVRWDSLQGEALGDSVARRLIASPTTGIPGLYLVSGATWPSFYEGQVYFLVRGDQVVLLNPLQGGVLSEGVDVSAWNQIVPQALSSPAIQPILAALACVAVRVVEVLAANSPCGSSSAVYWNAADKAWIVSQHSSNLRFRLTEQGQLLPAPE